MIEILSRNDAITRMEIDPMFPIIIIGETTNDDVMRLVNKSKNHCFERFDDTVIPRKSYKIVEAHQIENMLNWAKDKPNLIVACRAGISRSSATAYLIECMRSNAEEAIKTMEIGKHQPNRLVVEVGSKLLDKQNILEVHDKWQHSVWKSYIS